MAIKDLRQAVVSLRRAPAFTLTALIVLALGIGASTAIFSVVYGVLLRPLPFNQPDQLVRIWSSQEERNLPFFSVSMPDFADWRARARNLESLAAYERQRSISLRGEGEQVSVTRVSGDLFSLLGVSPLLGRVLTPADAAEGSAGAAVISHGLWQRRFGGRDAVLGQTMVLEDRSWSVVGVMPARFEIPNAPSDVWVPLSSTIDPTTRSARFLRVLGRVREDLQPEDATRELATIAGQLGVDYPSSNRGWGVTVRPLVETVVSPEFRRSVLLLVGAVAFVLLMASANVSGLLLGRATARQREMAIRTALGASKAALVRMLLIESLVLAISAGGVGLLLAAWGIDALKLLGFDSVPRLDDVSMSLPVLGFAAVVTLLTAGLFGVGPALLASRDTADALRARESSADARTSRSRSVLIVAEVALAVVLLVEAGLLMQSFARLQQRALGFDPSSLLVVQLAVPSNLGERADMTTSTEDLITKISALPGVDVVAGGSSLPFSGPNSGNTFEIEGEPALPGQPPAPDADVRSVTPDYFRALGIPVLGGRPFTERDGPRVPVVMINGSAARRYWVNRDPIGTRVRLGSSPWMTIIGIVGDTRYQALADPSDAVRPMMYVPHQQMPETPLMFALKTSTRPEALADSVRATLRAAAPDLALTRIDSMASILSRARGPQRFATALLALFAWVAVILAAAGLYGLLAYLVSRRTKEIGVRLALGATALDVIRLTAGRGAALTASGVVLGILASLGLAGFLRSVLFDVSATDPLTYAVVATGFLLVTAAASYLPVRRALHIDPVRALRDE